MIEFVITPGTQGWNPAPVRAFKLPQANLFYDN